MVCGERVVSVDVVAGAGGVGVRAGSGGVVVVAGGRGVDVTDSLKIHHCTVPVDCR